MAWTPFFFDGNTWFGLVDSPERWNDLKKTYKERSSMQVPEELLSAKSASGSLDAGQMPSFGFRTEHRSQPTLGVWAKEKGLDLS